MQPAPPPALNLDADSFFSDFKSWIGVSFAMPSILLLLGLIAYPVFEAVWLSVHDVNLYAKRMPFEGFGNFIEALSEPKFVLVTWNTFVWSAGSLIGQFALGLAAALAINQKLPGVNVIRAILLLPYVVPTVSLALLWRWMLDGNYGIESYFLQWIGLLDPGVSPLGTPAGAMASIIAANVWRSFPFVMIVYWAALQGIPQELYEAARVDGANCLQEFRHITWPGLRDATIALVVLRGIWTVTHFDLVWMITGGGPASGTLHFPIWIYEEAMGNLRFGYAAAIAALLGAVLLLLAFFFIKTTRADEIR